MLDLAFIGSLPPQTDRDQNPSYSPAGARFQELMLAALTRSGAHIDRAFVMWAAPAWPRGRLWFGASKSPATLGAPTRWLAFLNLPGVKSVTAGLTLFPRLLTWCMRHRRTGSSAVLLYNVTHPAGILSVWAGRLAHVPVIAVVADINIPGSGLVPDSPMRRAEFALQKYTLKRLDGIVALTRRMVDDFAPGVPNICVEGAIEESTRTPGRGRSEDRDFVIMYAGGLNELKGVPLLLDAFARLRGEHYRLWITGAGPLEERVRSAAEADSRIEFLGFVPYEEVQERYAAADLLVNPHSTSHASARYVFPSKLLEFIATGTPVLSTISTPELEEYRHVLYLVDDPDASAMAAAVERIAGMPKSERNARGSAARDWVLAHKTWASQARRICEFIAGLTDARAPLTSGASITTPTVPSRGAR